VARSASPWSVLESPSQRRLLEALRDAVDELAPGAARASAVAEKQWGILAIVGGGTRRLPGMRFDRRKHEIRAAYDGQFLQLTYRLEGVLLDSATLPGPAPGRLGDAVSFFRKHLPRVWWKAPPAEGAESPPPRGTKVREEPRPPGKARAKPGASVRVDPKRTAPDGRRRHRKA
jgi:hypothetical protein